MANANELKIALKKAFEMEIISEANYSETVRHRYDYKLFSEIEHFLEKSVTVWSVTSTEQFEVFRENVSLQNFVDYYYEFLGELVSPGASKSHKMAYVAILVTNGADSAKEFASKIEERR